MEDIDIRSLSSIAEVYAKLSEFLLDIIEKQGWKYGIEIEDRSEVLEMACEKVFKSRHTFKPGRNTGGWLYSVVLTTIFDYLDRKNRRKSKFGVLPVADYSKWLEGIADYVDYDDAEDEMIYMEEASRSGKISTRARQILETFSQMDQEIFYRSIEGEKSADIGEALGLTAVNVRQRLMKIKDKLRRLLTDEFAVEYKSEVLGDLQDHLRFCYGFAVKTSADTLNGGVLKAGLKDKFTDKLPVKVNAYKIPNGCEFVEMTIRLKEGDAVLDVSNAEMTSLMSFVGNIDSYIYDAETLFDASLRKSLRKLCCV